MCILHTCKLQCSLSILGGNRRSTQRGKTVNSDAQNFLSAPKPTNTQRILFPAFLFASVRCLCPPHLPSPPFHFPFFSVVTTLKSRPPHVSFAMSRRRHRSPPAATSVSFRPPRSDSSSVIRYEFLPNFPSRLFNLLAPCHPERSMELLLALLLNFFF
jgi:hypothetical protein